MTQTPTTPRPDEDRDKLAEAMYDWCPFRTSDGEPIPWAKTTAGDRSNLLSCADAIIAAGFTRTPAPRSRKDDHVTDAMESAKRTLRVNIGTALMACSGVPYCEASVKATAIVDFFFAHSLARAFAALSQQQQQPAGGEQA